MYDYDADNGTRRTVISFDPFLKRPDVRDLSDAQVGKRFGLDTATVKAMRRHLDVPFDTIQKICHELRCQPGEIMDAIEVWEITAELGR